jgi:hypothetical protein
MSPSLGRSKFRLPIQLYFVAPLFAIALSGSTCGVNPTPQPFTIDATPTGCGVKVDSTKTISWSVTFTASGVDPSTPVLWSFSDGTSANGQIVVHSFDTAALEKAAVTDTSDHDPVKFDITATVGGDTVTRTLELPMRGDPDGGPEPGDDTCIPDEGRTHVASPSQAPPGTTVCYNSNPPASGPHWSVGTAPVAPVAPGFYDEALRTEQWVHNLEHGTVVLLYDCGGTCSDELKAQLQALFDSVPEEAKFGQKKMVITRYAGVTGSCTGTPTFPDSGPFLAIAWDVQHSFDTLDTDGILDFYARHVDHGPEDEPIPP